MNLLKPDCPCGDPRCSAVGVVNPKTGHSRKCWDGCPVCARGQRSQGTSRKIPTAVRRQVRSRSGGRCEVVMPNGRCEFDADHMHHRRMRSQGGLDTFSNLLDCCSEHHDLIHDQPAWAMDEGYLIATSSGPEPPSSAVVRVEKIER